MFVTSDYCVWALDYDTKIFRYLINVKAFKNVSDLITIKKCE